MSREQWREAFEQVEERIRLHLEKLRDRNEVLRQLVPGSGPLASLRFGGGD